jgi:hypothetical protein
MVSFLVVSQVRKTKNPAPFPVRGFRSVGIVLLAELERRAPNRSRKKKQITQ